MRIFYSGRNVTSSQVPQIDLRAALGAVAARVLLDLHFYCQALANGKKPTLPLLNMLGLMN